MATMVLLLQHEVGAPAVDSTMILRHGFLTAPAWNLRARLWVVSFPSRRRSDGVRSAQAGLQRSHPLHLRVVDRHALSSVAQSCYVVDMSDTVDKLADVMPSATPSEEDIRKWAALPRDEQLRRLRAALMHQDCATATSDSMDDVLAAARARADSGRE
jgi:hypothetical protein